MVGGLYVGFLLLVLLLLLVVGYWLWFLVLTVWVCIAVSGFLDCVFCWLIRAVGFSVYVVWFCFTVLFDCWVLVVDVFVGFCWFDCLWFS